MRKKTLFWMPTLILLISAASVKAQVIIGGNGIDEPHAGAVLDLSPLGKQKLGLLLPSVELMDDAADFVLGDKEVSGEEKTAAAGMLVYNTAGVLHGKGLYVWNRTEWQPLKPAPTIKDAEGNEYFIGYFGDAGWWMTQNLRSTYTYQGETKQTINPGTNINNTYSAYYYYPSKEENIFTSHPEYGLLYTWAAANIGTNAEDTEKFEERASDRQGICPSGWHLPSEYEWSELDDVISASAAGEYSTTMEIGLSGTKMKSTTIVEATAKFPSPENPQGTSYGSGANGFAALLAGMMGSTLAYDYGGYAYFWSSSSYYNNAQINAWTVRLGFNSTEMHRYGGYKYYMFSVRCKKNE
jgi:uncharacterized protein (TIGR02145 family)